MGRKTKKRYNRKVKEPLSWRIKGAVVRVLGTAAAVTAVFVFLYAGSMVYEELLTSPHLEIRTIDVAGQGTVSKDEVIELSGIVRGRNILSVDLEEARQMVLRHPFIKGVRIKRRLPERVEIDITEWEPAAFVMVDSLHVMAAEGVLFKSYSVDDALDLPVITGVGEVITGGEGGLGYEVKPGLRPELVSLMGALDGGGTLKLENVSEIHFDPLYGFSVYTLDEGVRVDMGKEGFSRKVKNLNRVIRARAGSLSGIEAIDLTSGRGVVVRFIGGGKRRLV